MLSCAGTASLCLCCLGFYVARIVMVVHHFGINDQTRKPSQDSKQVVEFVVFLFLVKTQQPFFKNDWYILFFEIVFFCPIRHDLTGKARYSCRPRKQRGVMDCEETLLGPNFVVREEWHLKANSSSPRLVSTEQQLKPCVPSSCMMDRDPMVWVVCYLYGRCRCPEASIVSTLICTQTTVLR